MWLADICTHPSNRAAWLAASLTDEPDNQLQQFAGLIERQEMAAASDCLHRNMRNERARALAFGRPRPVLVTPDQQNRHVDAAIVFLRQLPTFRISEQADEGAVVL